MGIKLLTRYLLSSLLLAGGLVHSGSDSLAGSAAYPLFQAVPDTNDLQRRDTLISLRDSLTIDTIKTSASSNAIEAQVKCSAEDSLNYDIAGEMAYLYGNAEVYYKELSLKAAYIEVNFGKNEVYATGMADSTGMIAGKPVFTEGDQSFQAETMRYNFKTKKALITGVITQDGYGYLQGQTVKKMPNDDLNISGGYYTTCDDEGHPHFEFKYNKSR